MYRKLLLTEDIYRKLIFTYGAFSPPSDVARVKAEGGKLGGAAAAGVREEAEEAEEALCACALLPATEDGREGRSFPVPAFSNSLLYTHTLSLCFSLSLKHTHKHIYTALWHLCPKTRTERQTVENFCRRAGARKGVR
jgi:hypothetical protein